jgi:hypothetical protein
VAPPSDCTGPPEPKDLTGPGTRAFSTRCAEPPAAELDVLDGNLHLEIRSSVTTSGAAPDPAALPDINLAVARSVLATLVTL